MPRKSLEVIYVKNKYVIPEIADENELREDAKRRYKMCTSCGARVRGGASSAWKCRDCQRKERERSKFKPPKGPDPPKPGNTAQRQLW